ncbi:Dcp1p-Dcp2p decapping enzyme complex alpha subunit [Nowakowskiella sp. JEL0407]|nr:Dcp1p-Dcp2p decapping enzyme complex alpha subunit [Nowakowskiella sp. JEL0407]
MKVKKLELSYGMKSVFDSIPHLHHKSDGIIFTSKTAPYRIGTCEDMIKWKPADENTVDFKIRKVGPFHAPRFILQIWDGDNHFDLAELTLDDELQAEWSRFPPNDRIVECRYDPDWKNNWRFMRFRDDKANANHTTTFDKVMQSIKDGIDKATLLNEIPAIKANWKEREARLKEEKASPQPPPPANESRSNGIAPDQQGHIHVRGSNSSNGNGIKRTRNENETDNNGDQHHTKKVKAMAETNGSLEDNTQGVGETVQESNNESEVDEVEEEADENEDEFYELDEEDADEE